MTAAAAFQERKQLTLRRAENPGGKTSRQRRGAELYKAGLGRQESGAGMNPARQRAAGSAQAPAPEGRRRDPGSARPPARAPRGEAADREHQPPRTHRWELRNGGSGSEGRDPGRQGAGPPQPVTAAGIFRTSS